MEMSSFFLHILAYIERTVIKRQQIETETTWVTLAELFLLQTHGITFLRLLTAKALKRNW